MPIADFTGPSYDSLDLLLLKLLAFAPLVDSYSPLEGCSCRVSHVAVCAPDSVSGLLVLYSAERCHPVRSAAVSSQHTLSPLPRTFVHCYSSRQLTPLPLVVRPPLHSATFASLARSARDSPPTIATIFGTVRPAHHTTWNPVPTNPTQTLASVFPNAFSSDLATRVSA